MTEIVWRVVVARDIDDAAREALAHVGATYISGHSGAGYTSSSLLIRAEDEAGARAAIEQALGEHAFIREVRALPVFVHAPIDAEARSAFESAAGEDQRVGGVIEDERTGDIEVYFELPAGNVDRVFNEARGLYQRIVEAAGLPFPEPLEMSMSGFEALMVQASRDRQLLDRAQELMDSDEHELAVIVAQTACEVLVADALRSLLQAHVSDELRPWLFARLKSSTLVDDATRDLWNGLTGSTIQDEEFWRNYRAHVKRRHGIVHEGDRVDAEAARSSLDAAEHCSTTSNALSEALHRQACSCQDEPRSCPRSRSIRSSWERICRPLINSCGSGSVKVTRPQDPKATHPATRVFGRRRQSKWGHSAGAPPVLDLQEPPPLAV